MDKGVGSHTKGSLQVGFEAPSEQVFDNAKKLWRLTPQVLPLGFELTKTCPGFQTQVQSFPKMFQIYKI